MFTGIVSDIGKIRSIVKTGDTRLEISCAYDVSDIDIGASISCSGACLTVVETGRDDVGRGWFAIDASQETLECTTLGSWRVDTMTNLERALKLGDELGGHLVSGHVDGVGQIVSRTPEGDSERFTFEVPADLARFVAEKGSVTLDGTSLTVNEVEGSRFGVNVIPHTLSVTTWGAAQAGQKINVEIDMLARYVARLLETQGS